MQTGMLFLNLVPDMKHVPPGPLRTILARMQTGFRPIKSSASGLILLKTWL
jgi:hypothetical protein